MELLWSAILLFGLCGVLGVQLPRDSRCPAHPSERVHCPGHARTCTLARLDGCNRDGMYCCEDKCNDAVCYDRYGTAINVDNYRNDFVPNTQFGRDYARANNRDFNRNQDFGPRDPSTFDNSRYTKNFVVDNTDFDRNENLGLRDNSKRSFDDLNGGYD